MLQCFAIRTHISTVNTVVFFVRMMKIPTQKGEHSSKFTEGIPDAVVV